MRKAQGLYGSSPELSAVFGRRNAELFLEVPVEAAERIEAAFVGDVKDRPFAVLQEVTRPADAVLIDAGIVGDPDDFFEIA